MTEPRTPAELAEEAARVRDLITSRQIDTSLTSETDGLELRSNLANARADMLRAQREMREKAEVMKREFEAQMAKLRDEMAPMQEYLGKLGEVIDSVNLYLGREEEVVTITEGRPASVDTPITVRQMVLAMDEETLIAAERGGLTGSKMDLEAFDDWIRADRANLEQLLPEERGVVAIVPRRKEHHSGGREEDHVSWWLIRNGEMTYRMTTDIKVGRRLVPRQDELASYFRKEHYNHDTGEHEQRYITPGSHDYQRAEKAANANQRHFMRIGLILQGLVDRTVVFAPHAPGVSLLNPDTSPPGSVNIISDDERALTDGRLTYKEWITQSNARLDVGQRIVGAFDGVTFNDMMETDYDGKWKYQPYHSRISPKGVDDRPVAGRVYTVERSSKGELCIHFKRTHEVYLPMRDSSWRKEYRLPETSATCVLEPDDRWFVNIDAVTVADMERMMNDRSSRSEYVDMIPTLRAAIAFKRAEEEEQRDFRTLLVTAMVDAAGEEDRDAAEAMVDDLILWWKVLNKYHRSLVHKDDPELEARALQQIAKEYVFRREAVNKTGKTDAAVAYVKQLYPDVMAVLRSKSAGFVGFVPQPRRYTHKVFRQDLFVTEVTTKGADLSWYYEEWKTVASSRLRRMQDVWHDDRWLEWEEATTPGPVLTDDEVDEVLKWTVENATTYRPTGSAWERRQPDITGRTLVAVTVEGDRWDGVLRFTAYLSRTDESWAAGRSYNDGSPKVRLEVFRVTPFRNADRSIDWETYRSDYGHDWSATRTAPPWEGEDSFLAYVDKDAVKPLKRKHARVVKEVAADQALHQRARDVATAVQRRWENVRDHADYQRFLDDYAAPDLWREHQKGRRAESFSHSDYGVIERAAYALFTSTGSVEGVTVMDAVEACPADSWGRKPEVPKAVADYVLTEEEQVLVAPDAAYEAEQQRLRDEAAAAAAEAEREPEAEWGHHDLPEDVIDPSSAGMIRVIDQE